MVITVTSGVVEPRYPTFKGIMAAKSKPIDQISAGDLGVTITAGQEIVSVRLAPWTDTRLCNHPVTQVMPANRNSARQRANIQLSDYPTSPISE